MEIPCHLCIQVDCFSCVSLLQWEGQISCSESPEGLILLALLQDMPNCFSSPLLQGEGGIFHFCPSFFGSISLLFLKTLSSDATESALRLSRGPVTTPPTPDSPPTQPPRAALVTLSSVFYPLVGFDFFCVSTSPSSISFPWVVLCCDSGNSG